MNAVVALVLSQVALSAPALPAARPAPWPSVAAWQDGSEPRAVHLEPSLVAERDGTAARAEALRRRGAAVHRVQGRMRLWRVAAAPAELAADAALLPVYRDERGGRLRVPLGAVLVVPRPGTTAEALRATLGAGAVLEAQVVRLEVPARDVFARCQQLASMPGVAWAQPDWWVAARPK
ncbi:MAG: hypothetical protein INH41_10165 [Myxococcaceae bacterium]|jgi:hypothetical protein|nr:hypothetical protein [Myxococcaceae bacterium]